MRRFLSMLCAVVVMCSLAVPAFAAAPVPYIPVVPDFLEVRNGTISVVGDTKYLEPTTPAYQAFAKSLDDPDRPVLVLIEQGAKNPVMDAAGEDYDHKYWLRFIRFPKSTKPYNIGWFEYMNSESSRPFRFNFSDEAEMVSYFYDHEKDELTTSGKIEKVSSPLFFSYVMMSSKLSNPVAFYPNFDTLAGTGKFTVSSNVPGTDRHYNWWLSIEGEILPPYKPEDHLNEDTDGDGKPDINIDKDDDGKPDVNVDTDGDGDPDVNIDTDKDGEPDTNIDSDGDGKPDTNVNPDVDVDTDGDGKPDLNVDTNGDGKPDVNVDTNGDGKPDVNVDTNGDNKPDVNVDTNGDNKPDINVDTDNDGTPDVNVDTDGDGKPDTNVNPGGGSSGSNFPWDWFQPDNSEPIYNEFPVFDPFDYDYDIKGGSWDYDPLEGYSVPNMPEIPKASIPDGYQFHDPFARPPDLAIGDYWINFGG